MFAYREGGFDSICRMIRIGTIWDNMGGQCSHGSSAVRNVLALPPVSQIDRSIGVALISSI